MKLRVVHLMASPFFGGPERQMLGLARNLPAEIESVFVTFAERGLSKALVTEVRNHGFEAITLEHNFPHLLRSTKEVADVLRKVEANVVTCSGYKPDLIGWRAARRQRIPAIVVSHGWTGATWKVRVYEGMDRWVHRQVDAVVCVSESQADKVRKAGVAEERITVIPNAVGEEAFDEPRLEYREKLRGLFPNAPKFIVGAAGRLSPEKGFDQLIQAAGDVMRQRADIGFVIFGDGPLRDALAKQIAQTGLDGRVVLAGFRNDVGVFLPHLDAAVLSSFREGLPTILLEAFAAGLAVVGTTVGGIPEVIDDGRNGYLVPAGDPSRMANRILDLFANDTRRHAMGQAGRERVREKFMFPRQSEQYQALFAQLLATSHPTSLTRRPSEGTPENVFGKPTKEVPSLARRANDAG